MKHITDKLVLRDVRPAILVVKEMSVLPPRLSLISANTKDLR